MPIDEDHAALEMVYTDPKEQEEHTRPSEALEKTPVGEEYEAIYTAMWIPEEKN